MKLYEISKLMKPDALFKTPDGYVDGDTGEVYNQEYNDSLQMEHAEKTKKKTQVIKDMAGEFNEIDKEIVRLLQMKKTRENRIKSLKNYILHFGCAVNDVAVTVRFNIVRESLRIDDEVDVRSFGDAFYKTTYKADAKAIMAAIKEGKSFRGVSVVRNPFVVIK